MSPPKPIHVGVTQARLPGDAGLLPIRQFDEQTRFTECFASALSEQRPDDNFVLEPTVEQFVESVNTVG